MAKEGFSIKTHLMGGSALLLVFFAAPAFAATVAPITQQSAVVRETLKRQPTIVRLGQEAAIRIPYRLLPSGTRVTLISHPGQEVQELRGWVPLGNPVEVSGLDLFSSLSNRTILFRWKETNPSVVDRVRLAQWNDAEQQWDFLPTTIVQNGLAVQANLPVRNANVLAFAPDPERVPVVDPNFPPPHLDAASAIVIDDETGAVVFEYRPDEVRSIASITKLMSAMVFLDNVTGWDLPFTYDSTQDRAGARLRITDGEQLTMKDLFYTTLTGSANNTAVGLSVATPVSGTAFIQAMNQKASALGMAATRFVDPSGLEVENVSTARDVAKMAVRAFADLRILQATTVPFYGFETINTRIPHRIKNTNPIQFGDLRITGAKTGYIDEAGYCMVLKAQDSKEHELLAVVLGNPSSRDRFDETKALISWGFSAVTWPQSSQ